MACSTITSVGDFSETDHLAVEGPSVLSRLRTHTVGLVDDLDLIALDGVTGSRLHESSTTYDQPAVSVKCRQKAAITEGALGKTSTRLAAAESTQTSAGSSLYRKVVSHPVCHLGRIENDKRQCRQKIGTPLEAVLSASNARQVIGNKGCLSPTPPPVRNPLIRKGPKSGERVWAKRRAQPEVKVAQTSGFATIRRPRTFPRALASRKVLHYRIEWRYVYATGGLRP